MPNYFNPIEQFWRLLNRIEFECEAMHVASDFLNDDEGYEAAIH
ncbi:MAG: hypothetical protein AAF327_25540 [Cyanobacteria bacterium P01_A01_bin.37]